ncbi:MAG TPA: DUF1957 domain-containing protein, partial [Limnochordia bacterium]|nr:DUF1957 domain-containing protein [Limnochordia bacterium]
MADPHQGAPRQPVGSFALVLHAHLPYVHHAPGEHTLESRWLYEAITETYLPLLEVFDNLVRDGVPFRATIGLTPTLCAMLTDPELQESYVRHVRQSRELAEREIERTRREAPEFGDLAHFYRDLFERSLNRFEGYGRNLVDAFGRLQRQGSLELMASAATHGFLPLMEGAKGAAAAQIRLGVDDYRHRFGCDPKGFWLPECGFRPGDDRILADCGVRYIILDTHGLLHAQPRPLDANYAPVYTPAGVAAFGRDEDTSKQVWSADEGYPGDPCYREFYRDIGYDLPWEQVAPYLGTDFRHQTGIKYHRITGRVGAGDQHKQHKERYDLKAAIDRAAEHAGNFMFNRERQI